MPNPPLRIRVFYPRSAGRIVLRTDADWDADVAAVAVSADGTISTFAIPNDGPYFYFKPGLQTAEGFAWAQGANYLAIMGVPAGKDIYPFFYEDLSGDISDILTVPSPTLGSPRQIRVYRPPGYAENTLKSYPVLYMHDGQNLFFPAEAFSGVPWDVQTTMSLLDAMNVIDKVIVVGVYAQDRTAEYTQPGYERYGRFLVQELKPFVDAHYRSLADAPNTALMGSSLGGVVSLYLAWQWPDVFGKAACLSSTFGWQDDLLARIGREPRRPLQLYLDSGWPGDNYEVTRAMRDLLIARGYTPGADLLYLAFPAALHSETYWALRSHIPFQFFFGKTPTFSL